MPIAAPLSAQSLPQGGKVAAGGATIGQASGKGLSIQQSSNRAVIDWTSFSIGSGETVNFRASQRVGRHHLADSPYRNSRVQRN
jgi:large exoprotein involved in heme utilization and adhesion